MSRYGFMKPLLVVEDPALREDMLREKMSLLQHSYEIDSSLLREQIPIFARLLSNPLLPKDLRCAIEAFVSKHSLALPTSSALTRFPLRGRSCWDEYVLRSTEVGS